MIFVRVIRKVSSSVPVLVVAGLGLLAIGSFLSAHEDVALLPHKGHPPLHAQDTMRAFRDADHTPQSLSSMSVTGCVDGMAGSYPCNNIDLMSFLPLNQIGGGNGNDVWGWTDPLTGKEYALMGLTTGTSFIDVSDPVNPIYLGILPPHASNSTWRDIKVYADHAFMVSEANQSGMQVFDLTELRNVASPPATFSETAWYSGFLTAHNLVINEETGFAYAVGSNTCSAGLHMVDITTPTAPAFAGCFSADGYTHDAQCVVYTGPDPDHAGKEICFNSNEDTLTIVDVTNKSAPVQISRTGYFGSEYTHQGWLTQDHAYFLMDDELDESRNGNNTRTYIWNVSNLDAPVLAGTYTAATAAIDHNQYIKGDYTYQANYRAGLRILDISDIAIANLTEVAYFDIYPSSDAASFNGAWSNYPYFTSGIVVVSGIEQGLFVLKPNLNSTSLPPSVSIVSPAASETVGGSVTVQIDATDAEDTAGTLAVDWSVDGGAWQPATYNAGTGYYEAIWDTTTSGNGAKTFTARAADSGDNQSFDNHAVTVSNPLPDLHVASIEVTASHVNGPRYRGIATVTIVETGGTPVSGVTVDGAFTGDWNGSGSAATDSNGQANFQTPPVKAGSNWTFCVEDASKLDWTYDPGANVETCDSTGGAAGFGSVSGTVTDSGNGQPIQGANVSVDTGQNAATDGSGNYTIGSVPAGDRTVTATADGYASQQTSTNVSDSATSIVNFALEPSTSSGEGALKGTVTDSAGGRLSGVLVQTDTGQSAVTNNGGKYSIQAVPEGSRTVTASKSGYTTQQQTIPLAAGQNLTVDFALVPQ